MMNSDSVIPAPTLVAKELVSGSPLVEEDDEKSQDDESAGYQLWKESSNYFNIPHYIPGDSEEGIDVGYQPQIVNDKWTGSGRLKKRNHNGNDEKDLVQFVRAWDSRLQRIAENYGDEPISLADNPAWQRLIRLRNSLRTMLRSLSLEDEGEEGDRVGGGNGGGDQRRMRRAMERIRMRKRQLDQVRMKKGLNQIRMKKALDQVRMRKRGGLKRIRMKKSLNQIRMKKAQNDQVRMRKALDKIRMKKAALNQIRMRRKRSG